MIQKKLIHPRYWLLWLCLGSLWLLARLPYSWLISLGRCLGRLFVYLPSRARSTAQRNIAACLPELSALQQKKLLTHSFESAGIALFEIALAWTATDKRLAGLAHLHGIENLNAALQQGKGVILCSAHFTCLEIIGRLFRHDMPLAVMYRPQVNPVLAKVTNYFRGRLYRQAVSRDDLRGLLRCLKKNLAIWYTPDVDAGPKNSVFAPFFGLPAATITATSRLAAISGAVIIPTFFYRRDDNTGYDLYLLPPLENYPSDDSVQDATRVNQAIEQAILKKPEQYLWQYKRFKTRPEGMPDLYR